MRLRTLCAAVAASVIVVLPSPGRAQTGKLAVPGYEAARDVAGAKELPDPNIDYKVVFDIAQGAKDPAKDVNPVLPAIARYVNTLAKYNVPANHRHIAVVFHQGGTSAVMNSETFKSRNSGQDNPNLAIIHALKEAGVDFRVCGQALLANKIDPKQVNPDIEVDLWALTTMVNLQMRGYARIGA